MGEYPFHSLTRTTLRRSALLLVILSGLSMPDCHPSSCIGSVAEGSLAADPRIGKIPVGIASWSCGTRRFLCALRFRRRDMGRVAQTKAILAVSGPAAMGNRRVCDNGQVMARTYARCIWCHSTIDSLSAGHLARILPFSALIRPNLEWGAALVQC